MGKAPKKAAKRQRKPKAPLTPEQLGAEMDALVDAGEQQAEPTAPSETGPVEALPAGAAETPIKADAPPETWQETRLRRKKGRRYFRTRELCQTELAALYNLMTDHEESMRDRRDAQERGLPREQWPAVEGVAPEYGRVKVAILGKWIDTENVKSKERQDLRNEGIKREELALKTKELDQSNQLEAFEAVLQEKLAELAAAQAENQRLVNERGHGRSAGAFATG